MSPFKFGFSGGKILSCPSSLLEDDMELQEQLGKGHFGVVRACQDKKTGERFACKTISKTKLKCWEERQDVRREVEIMELLGTHPNLVSLRGTYEDEDSVHLVLDFCEGGELFDEISIRGPMSEKRAAQVMHGLAKAVAHCHSLGVFHRDLKPENILLVNKAAEQKENLRVKLADFGLSLRLREGQTVSGLAGSPYYLAPEVLSGSYGHQADVWSMGVVLYMMLSETAPFYGESEKEICQSISKAQLQFTGTAWQQVSAEAKELISQILQRDPSRRPSAKDILQHPWVLTHVEECSGVSTCIHRSSSSAPSQRLDAAESSGSLASGIFPSLSLPRGSTMTRDLLTWLSPQLVAANGEQCVLQGNAQSPLLKKFNEVMADLEDGVHYFVLDEIKEANEENCSDSARTLPTVSDHGNGLQEASASRKPKMYEPTPVDALDWIFGL